VIDLYYWPTPNGWKVSIMLEEAGIQSECLATPRDRGSRACRLSALPILFLLAACTSAQAVGEPASVSGPNLAQIRELSRQSSQEQVANPPQAYAPTETEAVALPQRASPAGARHCSNVDCAREERLPAVLVRSTRRSAVSSRLVVMRR
jgi:hypothetical protein